MGKALIKSELGKGLYSIEILYDFKLLEKRNTELKATLQGAGDTLQAANEKRSIKLGLLNAGLDDLNTLIGMGNTPLVTIEEAQIALLPLRAEIDELEREFKELMAYKAAAFYEKQATDQALVKYRNPIPVEAWCISYKEGILGEVDTIELQDEVNAPNDQAILISPTKLSIPRILTPAISLAPWTTVYMLTALPAQQKWRPEYREGKITAIDAVLGHADVTFNFRSPVSSVRGTNNKAYIIDQTVALTDVPIDYGICPASLFDVNDRVVVSFEQDWATPRIIGFTNNPKKCDITGYTYKLAAVDTVIYTSGRSIPLPSIPATVQGATFNWNDLEGTSVHWEGSGVRYNNINGVTSGAKVYHRGILVYTASGGVLGAAVKAGIVAVLYKSGLSLNYTFTNTDGAILGSGSVAGLSVTTWLQIIAINSSVTEGKCLVYTPQDSLYVPPKPITDNSKLSPTGSYTEYDFAIDTVNKTVTASIAATHIDVTERVGGASASSNSFCNSTIAENPLDNGGNETISSTSSSTDSYLTGHITIAIDYDGGMVVRAIRDYTGGSSGNSESGRSQDADLANATADVTMRASSSAQDNKISTYDIYGISGDIVAVDSSDNTTSIFGFASTRIGVHDYRQTTDNTLTIKDSLSINIIDLRYSAVIVSNVQVKTSTNIKTVGTIVGNALNGLATTTSITTTTTTTKKLYIDLGIIDLEPVDTVVSSTNTTSLSDFGGVTFMACPWGAFTDNANSSSTSLTTYGRVVDTLDQTELKMVSDGWGSSVITYTGTTPQTITTPSDGAVEAEMALSVSPILSF